MRWKLILLGILATTMVNACCSQKKKNSNNDNEDKIEEEEPQSKSGKDKAGASTFESMWPDGSNQKWKGVWDSKRGVIYNFVLDLNRNGSATKGAIHWRLVKVPPGHRMTRQLGNTGNEFVQGTVNPKTGDLEISGTSVDNPQLLAKDDYLLTVTNGGKVTGHSKSNGKQWKATFNGTKLKANEAADP
jgi:hypothetical protein